MVRVICPSASRPSRVITGGHVPNRPEPSPVSLRPSGIAARDSGYIHAARDCQSSPESPRFQGETRGSPRQTRVPYDPVNGGSPGAVPHAARSPCAQPLHELPRLAGREPAALDGREPATGDALHFRQGGPKVRQIALRECGEELQQHEVRDALHLARGSRWIGGQAVQLVRGARHRERELGPRAEPGVGGNRAMQAKAHARVEAVVRGEPLCERERALGVRPFGCERRGAPRLEQQRRDRHRGADAAEAAPEVAAQVQDPKVETRRRLDHHRSRVAHRGAACSARAAVGAERTYSVSSAMASRSRGPAVLSTITCSRANSSRICSAGSRWVRVARIAASSTACRARLKPRNSRRTPRCTTVVTTRARGGVASMDRTSTSRHEQAASSTTPRTTLAGAAGNWTSDVAPRAKSITSSVRFTTAAPVSRKLRNVVVSRNGLMTISASPHSTPIGAKFTLPAGSIVVRIDSMITGRTPPVARRTQAPVRAPARRPPGRGAPLATRPPPPPPP